MKKLFAPALAAALLLAACNSTEEEVPKEETVAKTEQQVTAPEAATPESVETPAEQPQQTTEVEQAATDAKIYVSDANAESVELGETVKYSEANDGPLADFIIKQLGFTQYYNGAKLSEDEKTITIDFNEELLASNLVQGSAGSSIFTGQVYASFFETLPTLENIELRVNGEEVEMDHISFVGAVKRADYEAVYE